MFVFVCPLRQTTIIGSLTAYLLLLRALSRVFPLHILADLVVGVMAPLTTAEVIAQADYLTDNFDPKSLTVAQLLGVFSYHSIRYPANAKKGALVSLFEKEITGNIDKLREQRMAIDGSQASDRGITDGISGKQINDPDVSPFDALFGGFGARARKYHLPRVLHDINLTYMHLDAASTQAFFATIICEAIS